jgi:hypothetical protein
MADNSDQRIKNRKIRRGIRRGDRKLPGEVGRRLKQGSLDAQDLITGIVKAVDNERGLISVEWRDQQGSRENVPITASADGAGYINYVPDIGDMVICGWLPYQEEIKTPIPIAYLANKSGSFDRYHNHRIHNVKLYPGEISIGSEQGSLIYVESGVKISDRYLNEFGLDHDRGQFYVSSESMDQRAGGSVLKAGAVIRDGFSVEEGKEVIKESGLEVAYITRKNIDANSISFGNPEDQEGIIYSEFRVEVPEVTDLTKDHMELRESGKKVIPVVELVLGNTVGNRRWTDSSGNTQTNAQYGRPYRFNIFDHNGELQRGDKLIDQTTDVNEDGTIMPAYFLRLPKSGSNGRSTTIAIDKEGQYFAYIAASNIHPSGKKNSAQIATEGKVMMQLGSDDNGVSLKSKFVGSWVGSFGKSTEIDTGNSARLTLAGSARITMGSDTRGIATELVSRGDYTQEVSGNATYNYNANLDTTAASKVENIGGSATHTYQGSHQTTINGNQDLNLTGTQSSNIVKGRATIIATAADSGLADELLVLQGDSEHTHTVGNKTTFVLKGDFVDKVAAGNREIAVTAGNIDLKTTFKGDINMSAQLGNINMSSVYDTVIKALNFNVIARKQANIKAPIVAIGQSPNATNPVPLGSDRVITSASHKDYLTGAPLVPVANVHASLK